jgi:hypothetical protein
VDGRGAGLMSAVVGASWGERRLRLFGSVFGSLVDLAMDRYGNRVVQKFLEKDSSSCSDDDDVEPTLQFFSHDFVSEQIFLFSFKFFFLII